MISLRLVAVACTLLVVQSQGSSQPELGNLIVDLLKNLVPRIEALITRVLATVDKLVTDAITDAAKFQKDLVELASKGLDRVLDFIHSRLEKIKEAGDKNTAKLVNCLESSRNPAKLVVVNFVDSITKCEVPMTKQVLQSIADLEPYVQSLNADLFQAADGIQKCAGTDQEQTECALKVFENILKIVGKTQPEVLVKIIGLISNAVKLVSEVWPKCIAPQLPQSEQEFVKVINSVAYCVIN